MALLCPLVALVATLTAMSWIFPTPADAALTDVSVDPTSGEAGTTVTVSGSACPPGLLVNPSRAGVLVITLGVTIDVAVPADGAWSVEFVVPVGALQGPHAIVATCTRDLLPLPYAPLTFTVTAAEATAPTTTIELAAAATTTIPPTTLPATTTRAAAVATSTTIEPAVANGAGENEQLPDDRPSSASSTAATVPGDVATTAPSRDPATATSTIGSLASAEDVVSAARTERDDRRRPLVFGALSPIGRGWVGALMSGLIAVALASGVVALLWFRWLRHTRAREWWIRWFNQILRIRTHARPPT